MAGREDVRKEMDFQESARMVLSRTHTKGESE